MPCVVLLAAWLRLMLLNGQRFHPDEALYATWARLIATGQDVWLAERVVDKPPLFIYMLASLFGTFGASEEIARLPSVIAGVWSVALVYGIADELYHDRRVALLAACVLALSPLAMLFAPTAFVDPLMVCLLLASLWCVLRGRFGWSGFAFGLSLATKQDAMLFAPLLWPMADGRWLTVRPPPPSARVGSPDGVAVPNQKSKIKNLKWFLFGCAPPLLLVLLWAAARPQPDFLQASLAHYGGLSLAQPDEYVERTVSLLRLSQTLSSPWLLGFAAIVSLLLIARRRSRVDVILCVSIVYWLMIHLVMSFPIWDRYLLPLTPLVALLIARTVVFALDQIHSRSMRIASLALIAMLLAQPARAAMRDEIHVGRDFDLHAGVDQVGEFFWRIDTTATIMYVHDLSWELDYYTFGRELDRRWMESPEQLAADAVHMPLAQRFVVLAEWESFRDELPAALATENLKAEPAFIARRHDGSAAVYVYRLTPKDVGGSGHSQSGSSAFVFLY